MSHFTRVRTTLRDPALLAAALRETGFRDVEVHAQPQQIRGWANATRRAEVIVRRESLPQGGLSDLGFARRRDGSFEAIMDGSLKHRFGSQWLPQLTQAYGHAAALKYAEDHGYEVVTDESETDGTRRLTLRRYA
jgi:hypothetical protein